MSRLPAIRLLGSRARRSPGSLALAASGWVVLAATALPGGSIVRVTAAFGFVLVCPGAALVRFWPERDSLERAVLIVAVSTAIAVMIAEGLILVDAWSAGLALIVLSAITTVASLLPSRALPPKHWGSR